jgi:lipopolysaccharide transport system ATP-binding protein
MSDAAVIAQGLGKRYRLGPVTGPGQAMFRYGSLRETLSRSARRLFGRRDRAGASPDPELFWALRDVSFEVGRGEVLGIIGRNGAGKSTLLKILSRVTEPTEGFAELRGRVGSLLEVGTGFHPELTGRENIHLNGAILGMKVAEIRSRFDEIVAFAEVERFLETPVKHYSSGMYLRLAFAVAAHLEPEILIVDEVLAVGDAAFQRKCLGKMSDITRQGRTVLFVSHNMQAVRQLCSRAILLQGGQITQAGPSTEVVDHYLAAVASSNGRAAITQAIAEIPEDPAFRLRDVRVLQDGRPRTDVVSGKEIVMEVAFEVREESVGLHVCLQLRDPEGMLLFETIHNGAEDAFPRVLPGSYSARATIPADFLAPTTYELCLLAGIHGVRSFIPRPIRIPLTVTAVGRVNRAYPGYRTPGRLAPLIAWSTERTGP